MATKTQGDFELSLLLVLDVLKLNSAHFALVVGEIFGDDRIQTGSIFSWARARSAHQCAMRYTDAVKAAGFEDVADKDLGDALFEAILASRDGVTITRHTYEQGWMMLRTEDGKVNADIPELIDDLAALCEAPIDYRTAEYPFILSAGERRAFTANTIMRDPTWRKKDADGALRVSPADAARLGIGHGDTRPHHNGRWVSGGSGRGQRDHAGRPHHVAEWYGPVRRNRL